MKIRKKMYLKVKSLITPFANIKYSSIDFKSLMEELMEWKVAIFSGMVILGK